MIPDKFWDEIKLVVAEKPEQAVNGRCAKRDGSGSKCHRWFQEWTVSKVFQRLRVRVLEVYDDLRGIKLLYVIPDRSQSNR